MKKNFKILFHESSTLESAEADLFDEVNSSDQHPNANGPLKDVFFDTTTAHQVSYCCSFE